jgi:hypothetical protein
MEMVKNDNLKDPSSVCLQRWLVRQWGVVKEGTPRVPSAQGTGTWDLWGGPRAWSSP